MKPPLSPMQREEPQPPSRQASEEYAGLSERYNQMVGKYFKTVAEFNAAQLETTQVRAAYAALQHQHTQAQAANKKQQQELVRLEQQLHQQHQLLTQLLSEHPHQLTPEQQLLLVA